MDNVWHVLDVLEGSPAESAGLVPYGDWIIGWSGGILSAESDFYEVVEAVCLPCVLTPIDILTYIPFTSILTSPYEFTFILMTLSTC